MATGVLKVRVGGAWQVIGPAGPTASHHVSHEPGGADALVVLDAGILTQGALPDARLSINVLKVPGGFPGGLATFLRADGTFAQAGVGGPASAVVDDVAVFANTTGTLIRDSGLGLSNIPRLRTANTFAGGITATTLQATTNAWGSLGLTHSDATTDLKNFQMYYASGNLVLRAMSDNWATQFGYFVLNKSGAAQLSGNLQLAGVLTIGNPDGSWPSLTFNQTYFTFNHTSGGQLAWLHQNGIFQLNMGDLRFNPTTFKITNASATAVLTIRNDGVVTVPFYLVVPVGTDKWAPA
jgi:hypothetical protein